MENIKIEEVRQALEIILKEYVDNLKPLSTNPFELDLSFKRIDQFITETENSIKENEELKSKKTFNKEEWEYDVNANKNIDDAILCLDIWIDTHKEDGTTYNAIGWHNMLDTFRQCKKENEELKEHINSCKDTNERLQETNCLFKEQINAYGKELSLHDSQAIDPSVLRKIDVLDKALDKACMEKAKKEYIDDDFATDRQINNRAKEIKDYLLKESEKVNGKI